MKKSAKRYLRKPVASLKIDHSHSVSELLRGMEDTAFQGKNLALAATVWEDMLRDSTTIFFGLAGAMVPAGMRGVVAHLIKQRYIDCLVSTGANLFHDIHETLGRYHWQGTHHADDNKLWEEGIDRIYDVFALEEEFNHADRYIYDFSLTLEKRPYTTREFFQLLGKNLSKNGKKEGIITSAYKAGVPVYCPAIGDSSIGISLALKHGHENFLFDVIGDVKETAHLASRAKSSGVVFAGGGTPKNFIQQTEVTANLMGKRSPGHKYAIQITADAPHWGGLSGCTFEEAQSWGKIAIRSKRVTVNSDVTVAMPLIVTALSQRMKGVKRRLPDLSIKGSERVRKRIWEKR